MVKNHGKLTAAMFALASSLITRAVLAADSTNAPSGSARQAYHSVRIYNAAPASASAASVKPIIMHRLSMTVEQPERLSLRASEQRFKLGFGAGQEENGGVIIPHAVQGPRPRLFDGDDEERGSLLSGASDRSPWNTDAEQGWGWLARDISKSRRSEAAMIELNNEVTYRRNALTGSSGMQESLFNRRLGRSDSTFYSDPSPSLSLRPQNPYAPFSATDPSSRNLPYPQR
ncbi:MAG: hypothetical protein O3C57_00020 [Verrucomicrobia bacterium]|nr:hypothetical protein [Verrucomicrobiota bacterium]